MSKVRAKRAKTARDWPPQELVDVARAAIDLYHHQIDGRQIASELDLLPKADQRDAHAMGAALICIRHLLDEATKKVHQSALSGTGLFQAYDLLDALTTGHDWTPFWRHVAGLKTAVFRPQNAPPSAFENTRRSMMVGFVRALQQVDRPDGVGRPNQSEAIKIAINVCNIPGVEFRDNQIRGWARHSKEPEGSERIARDIIANATKMPNDRPLTDRVLMVGHNLIWTFWSVPHIGPRSGQ